MMQVGNVLLKNWTREPYEGCQFWVRKRSVAAGGNAPPVYVIHHVPYYSAHFFDEFRFIHDWIDPQFNEFPDAQSAQNFADQLLLRAANLMVFH